MLPIATWMLAVLAFAPPAPAGTDPAARKALDGLLARVPQEVRDRIDPSRPGDREGFLAVLSGKPFLHQEVGPFDLYVMQADGFENAARAAKTLKQASAGLEPLLPVMARCFGGEPGLIAGRRLPIVLAHADRSKQEASFDQLVALLDWADDDYSGWKPSGNPIWSPELRAGLTVRTWEVQLFNLANAEAADHGDAYFEHGLGYYTLAHIAARVLRQGVWGMVPPWLAQGLIDELDISAYGQAWVGGDWWEQQTPGWYRPGWSGFVPQGASPPAPVTGPPADLAVTVKNSGDSWQHRANSGERHWADLAADRRSEAPASFEFMAENESFLPRDRAYARCVLHMLLDVARPDGDPPLTQLLDRVPSTPRSGMPDSDPITVVFDRVLGGVPAVEALEALPLGAMLDSIGHAELARHMEQLGAGAMLDIADHRQQAEWLYRQPQDAIDWEKRTQLFNLILEAEYYQQLEEWKLIGATLDRAASAAFAGSASYPKKGTPRQRAREAFRKALQHEG